MMGGDQEMPKTRENALVSPSSLCAGDQVDLAATGSGWGTPQNMLAPHSANFTPLLEHHVGRGLASATRRVPELLRGCSRGSWYV